MIIKNSFLLTFILSCSLAQATKQSISPLKSLLSIGLGITLLYNLHHKYQATKHKDRLLAHTAGALASGYLVGDVFQKDSPFDMGNFVASGVLTGSFIAYKKPYPNLLTTGCAFGLGIMLKVLSQENSTERAEDQPHAAAFQSESPPQQITPSTEPTIIKQPV